MVVIGDDAKEDFWETAEVHLLHELLRRLAPSIATHLSFPCAILFPKAIKVFAAPGSQVFLLARILV